jgi:hypothetical protein
MNWYNRSKFAMPLDPGAWSRHEKTHRLLKDMPTIKTPMGTFRNQVSPQHELERRYHGVHATVDSLQLAALYANNISSPQDPPVVVQFSAHQQPELDVDSEFDSFGGLMEAVQDDEEAREIGTQPYNREDVEALMRNIELMYVYGGDEEIIEDVNELIARQARTDHPSAITRYFRDQYREQAPFFFYRDFLMPLFQKRGNMDDRWMGYVINQVRFHDPIHDEQVIAIYVITPWKDRSNDREFDPNETEGTDPEGYENVSLHGNWGYDFEPSYELAWSASNPYLFEMPSFYHGTSTSRAMQALPQFGSIFRQIMQKARAVS